MGTPLQAMRQLLAEDQRFSVEAYQFIREALQFVSENPDRLVAEVDCDQATPMGEPANVSTDAEMSTADPFGEGSFTAPGSGESHPGDSPGKSSSDAVTEDVRHVTGGQLCHACRHYALEQYGYLAPMVLGKWGIHSTSHLGDLVYNLIRIGQMRKSDSDRREDFDDVFDFENAFEPQFETAVFHEI